MIKQNPAIVIIMPQLINACKLVLSFQYTSKGIYAETNIIKENKK
jgi:hypothetical protein